MSDAESAEKSVARKSVEIFADFFSRARARDPTDRPRVGLFAHTRDRPSRPRDVASRTTLSRHRDSNRIESESRRRREFATRDDARATTTTMMRAVTRATRRAARARCATTATAAGARENRDPRQHDAATATARGVGAARDGWFAARASDEMPMRAIADAIGDALGPAVDAIAEAQRRRGEARGSDGEAEAGLYVPDIPAFLCATRLARDSPMVRSVLVVDERAPRTKPRLSWYDVDDESWAPKGWWEDGVKADFAYYFGERRESSMR